MDISVVIPVYNEAEVLPELYRALADALDRLPQSAEIIFANDGSTDGSAEILDALADADPRVRVLHPPAPVRQIEIRPWPHRARAARPSARLFHRSRL